MTRAEDQTLELLRQGYRWAPELRDGAEAVRTRLLGRPAVLVGGPAGVRCFYDDRLRRRGAFPPPIRLVLFGPGNIHGLDDAAHHERKAMFVDTLNPASVMALIAEAEKAWSRTERSWAEEEEVTLLDEAVQVIAAAVFPWAGVPVDTLERRRRAQQLSDIIGGFATPGRPYLRAVLGRVRTHRWARRLIGEVRAGRIDPPAGTALDAVTRFRDGRGRPLPPGVAATELHNFVRPCIAVAWFVAFAAVALRENPDWRTRIAAGEPGVSVAFAHEVRRHYPFVPVLAARARHRQDVLGITVPRGGLVVLDVFGTDRDGRSWSAPDAFDPDRFLVGSHDSDALVPQGGGDVRSGHRCPGEDITLALLEVAVRHLAARDDAVVDDGLDYDPTRMPARPGSGVRLRPRPAEASVASTQPVSD